MRLIMALLATLGLLLAAGCAPSKPDAKGPLVLAPSSLQAALGEAAQAWAKQGNPEPVLSFAATPALARQIEAGAPADLFLSADEQWMDDLAGKSLIRDDSRRDLLGNALVVIAPADAKGIGELDIGNLASALGPGRLALADPASVPAGRYARQALTKLGVWQAVEAKVVPAENVRAALALVARGEAALGVVYATDARAEPGVRVAHTFAQGEHAPIVYPAAVLKTSKSAQAKPFLDWLSSAEAAAIFRKHGFTVPVAR
jgi:molybdate transport system substrate-binding protein